MTNEPNGRATARLVSVDEGGLLVPVVITQNGANVSYVATAVPGTWTGVLRADGTELTGTFTQGLSSLPLNSGARHRQGRSSMDFKSPVCPVNLTASQAENRGLAWVIGSFVLCPCHLPITLWGVALLLSGTAAGALLRSHPVVAGVIVTALWLAGTWRGIRYLLMARSDPPAALKLSDPSCGKASSDRGALTHPAAPPSDDGRDSTCGRVYSERA